jgi:putative Mn2+ efflux pump MntP
MDNKENKKRIWKARLIALGAALLMLAAAMGVTFWQYNKYTAAYLPFDLTGALIVNGIGCVVMYAIIAHFLKKSFCAEKE